MILSETPRRKQVTKLVSWAHWFALQNIIIAILIAAIYVFSSPVPDTPLGVVYMLTNWFSHIGFLTFFTFVIVILPMCYLIQNAKVVKGVSSVLVASGLALLAFDALLYTRYGLHMSFSGADLVKQQAQTVFAELSVAQWSFLVLLFIVWLAFQLITANALWQRIERFQKVHIGLPITGFFVTCFIASHSTHIWADAKLYQPIIQQDDMFPLSYPATAKNLLSKYGMLDIDSHKTRKQLLLSTRIDEPKYPASPMYCSINPTSKMVILIQTDGQLLPDFFTIEGLKNQKEKHYDFSQNLDELIFSSLYGLPALYQQALHNKTAILLDMPNKLALPLSIYANKAIDLPGVNQQDWNQFVVALQSDAPKLAIGYVNQQQMAELVTKPLLRDNQYLISAKATNSKHQAPLITNLPLVRDSLSSIEDIAPTVIAAMNCNAPAANFSTGENIANAGRDWLISNLANKVILLDNDKRIEINNNGSYKVFDLATNEQREEKLNTNLLSQAMKHLTRFNQQ